MSHEMPSDFELDMIEHQADLKAATVNSQFGDVDENPNFDFCDGCPRVDRHTPEEVKRSKVVQSWQLSSSTGASVIMELAFPDGSRSKPMLLGRVGGFMMTGLLANKLTSDAARRTQECERPKRIPSFLGPLGIKVCPAVSRYIDLDGF